MAERIESADHPAFAAAAALSTRLGRAAAGRYLVEGAKLVKQAAEAGVLRAVFGVAASAEASEACLLEELEGVRAGTSIPVYEIPLRLAGKLIGTDYQTRVEAVGVVERRVLPAMPATGLLLACESIQDPRNVGVLVRTAECAGAAAIAFSDDGADPFSRGAVRSSTGSIIRQPLHLAADLPATLAALRARGVRVIGTSARAGSLLWDLDLTGDRCLVVGNESAGLSAAARAACDHLVCLPTAGGASSLNVTVAAGAMLYEAVRQRRG